jgi:hypothetical protein
MRFLFSSRVSSIFSMVTRAWYGPTLSMDSIMAASSDVVYLSRFVGTTIRPTALFPCVLTFISMRPILPVF